MLGELNARGSVSRLQCLGRCDEERWVRKVWKVVGVLVTVLLVLVGRGV